MTGYKTITGMSLRQLSEALAAGEVTSRQATQAYLDAIAAADGDVAAYLTVTGPEALAAAEASDARRAAGKALGPLDGVPRSEERRVGKGGTSWGRSRGSRCH